ncbi:MAG: Ig-like domain-containing protein [Cyanobacteriota bacterium]|nr:Ig-like domain-containing protein [Cyanobacteriota bacterium]
MREIQNSSLFLFSPRPRVPASPRPRVPASPRPRVLPSPPSILTHPHLAMTSLKPQFPTTFRWLPIDRIALSVILGLTTVILVLVLGGDRTVPRIREFTWENRQVGSTDRAFLFTFNRPMDRASVEENLQIEPPLPGKISWAGRRMAYTLDRPAPYGIDYTVKLSGARDTFAKANDTDTTLEPFEGKFRSRDLAFVYLGVEASDAGRLFLYNITREEQTVLTPPDLRVMDYEIYPQSDRILFSAIDSRSATERATDVQLYTVTTGIHPHVPGAKEPRPERAGQIERILDNQDYQNLQFDLSEDGETIVVQRANRKNPGAKFGLWAIRDGQEAKPLENAPGGEFLIAPSGREIAIAQGQGIALLPLDDEAENASEPLEFFAEYGLVMDFKLDGSAAAMVMYNPDYTRSLYLVPNQGEHQQIIKTNGSILDAKFDPTGQFLYCLLTDLEEGEEYREIPYIAQIDLESQQFKRLLTFEDPRPDIHIDVAGDGLSLMFDRIINADFSPGSGTDNALRTNSGLEIASSDIWLLFPLVSDGDSPAEGLDAEQLPINGFNPRWLP